MHWVYLVIAGLLEIAWATGLKYSDGLTKIPFAVPTVITMIGSFVFLALAIRDIPVGTGYAIWTGIGAAGTAILGIILFSESTALFRLGFIALIIIGVIGLRFTVS